MQRVLAFEFNHDCRVDHQISSEPAVKLDAIINNRHRLLSLNFLSEPVKFIRQACFIRRFEQAGPEPPMNRDRGSNDFVTKIAGHLRIVVMQCFGAAEKSCRDSSLGILG